MVKRLLFKLTWFVPLLLLVAGVNYAVDPANLFHPAVMERQVAGWLSNGQNVEGLSDYDERKLQLYWLEGLKAPRPTAVLGSSRAMGLSGEDLYNHSVSGATLPDYLALGQLYRDRGWTPKKLLVVADPWLFNRMNRETRWKSLYPQYTKARQELGLAAPAGSGVRLDLALELLSPSYFQASLEKLFRPHSQGMVRPTAAWEGEQAIKHADGSLLYGKSAREESVESVRARAIKQITTPPVYGLERYEELDPEKQREFEAWLSSWKAAGTEVELVLAPYHPEAWRRITSSPRFARVLEAETWLRSLGYPVRGSYNPQGWTEADFYDFQHPKPYVLVRR